MRVYIDVCWLNRPLDDQSQARVRLEADAVEVVLQLCSDGAHTWVSSPVVDAEAARNPDPLRRGIVADLLRGADECAEIRAECEAFARVLASRGVSAMDALHLAAAERARCDVYLTTDDRLVRAASRCGEALTVRVVNPVVWLMEITER